MRALCSALVVILLGCSKPAWQDLSGTPPGFADSVDNDALASLSCADGMTVKWSDSAKAWQCVAAAGASWASLSGIPAGFADGTDNDALGALSCASGDVASWSGTTWVCARDKGAFTDTGTAAYYTGGRVGIGTTSPAQALSVAGTIESTAGGIKFPDGTTQLTAARGGVRVEASGTPVGALLSFYSPFFFVLTSTSFIVAIDATTGQIANAAGGGQMLLPIFTTASCTGTPYANQLIPGTVIVKSGSTEVFYIARNAVPASITALSYFDQSGACATTNQNFVAYALSPNNAAVTGVTSGSFALPITLAQ